MPAPTYRPLKPVKSGKEGNYAKEDGPVLSRHIPWPEIINLHISSLEGYVRMLEMVQKHTLEGSENWKIITPMIERNHNLIREFKVVNRAFMPGSDTFSQVPLGASSDSMYPGYSINDHKYGEALRALGEVLAKLGKQAERQPKNDASTGNENEQVKVKDDQAGASQPQPGKTEVNDPLEEEDVPTGPLFVIDTKPTPVNLPQHHKRSRSSEETSEALDKEGFKSKKRKGKGKKEKKEKKSAEQKTSAVPESTSGTVGAEPKHEENAIPKGHKKRSRESAMSRDAEDGSNGLSDSLRKTTDASEANDKHAHKDKKAKSRKYKKPPEDKLAFIEFEDISAEVDAALKAREEKVRHLKEDGIPKEERKRARETENANGDGEPGEAEADHSKVKKKRTSKRMVETVPKFLSPEPRLGGSAEKHKISDEEPRAHQLKKHKKSRKDDVHSDEEKTKEKRAKVADEANDEGERRSKKRRRS
ncbi:MAG: hypothetical protein M1825_003273 [Sarcosagium campestre]|nr:MAG: hypothetical protein M1825_003273 [Sarcosagium campestre]